LNVIKYKYGHSSGQLVCTGCIVIDSTSD